MSFNLLYKSMTADSMNSLCKKELKSNKLNWKKWVKTIKKAKQTNLWIPLILPLKYTTNLSMRINWRKVMTKYQTTYSLMSPKLLHLHTQATRVSRNRNLPSVHQTKKSKKHRRLNGCVVLKILGNTSIKSIFRSTKFSKRMLTKRTGS